MKNFILLIFSVLLVCLFSEAAIRYARLPFLLEMHDRSPKTEHTKYGYFNANSGSYQPNHYLPLEYHYFSPHLRDTSMNPKAKHILVLGDSFTFGLHLPWQETYIYQLQQHLDRTFGKNHYQLLNAATPSWGTSNYLSYLEYFGSETNPEYVLVFLNSDDIGRSIKNRLYNTSIAISDVHSIPNLSLTLKEKLFNSWLFNHSELMRLIYYEMLSFIHRYHGQGDPSLLPPMSADLVFNDDFAVRYAEMLFRKINLWCIQHHARLLVVTTGFNGLYPNGAHDPTQIFLLKAKDFYHKEKIPFYDTQHIFIPQVKGKQFQIPRDGHPNAFGARVITETTWPWLKQQLEHPSHA